MRTKNHYLLIWSVLILSILVLFPMFFYCALNDDSSVIFCENEANNYSADDKTINLPFTGFISNLGQLSDDSIEYFSSINTMTIGFANSSISFSVPLACNPPVRFSIYFPGSQTVSPMGYGKKSSSINYFYEDLQFTNVPSWEEVWYIDLYPGIDLRYYMSEQGLKYEWIVHPGANPEQITMKVSDPMILSIEENVVSIQTRKQPNNVFFQDTALTVFQADDTLNAYFILKDSDQLCYGFQIEPFDSTQTLIIDPLWLSFSTLLGGDGGDQASAIAVDAEGNCYITGETSSILFPLRNSYSDIINGNSILPYSDAFIAKLSATGDEILFSTYLGGSRGDYTYGITLDAEGNCVVTGSTTSPNFPTVNAYQSTHSGGYDVFVTKLNATGNGLIFSTFLGGDSRDIGEDIVLDAAGNYYVTGYTFSENFPTKNAYQSDFGGYSDAFITKLNATGNGLLFCTFLGDDNRDRGLDISIDSAGNSYITGDTNSINFPIVNAYQSAFGGGESDVFVTKLNATGNGLLYSTFVGGSNFEFGFGTVVDDAGHCGVVGFTTSSDFPVANAFQSIYGGGESDAFVLRLDTTDSTLLFSTFLGGNLADQGSAIAVDDVGHYYVVGITYSYNFPVVDAYQGTLNTEGNDVFAAKLDHSGNLLFSTYFGGLFEELGSDIAVGTNGQFYIAGATFSEDFPLENAYQTSPQGYYDAFITKFSYDPTSGPTSSPTSTTSTDSFTITIFLIATFPLILAIKRRRKVF